MDPYHAEYRYSRRTGETDAEGERITEQVVEPVVVIGLVAVADMYLFPHGITDYPSALVPALVVISQADGRHITAEVGSITCTEPVYRGQPEPLRPGEHDGPHDLGDWTPLLEGNRLTGYKRGCRVEGCDYQETRPGKAPGILG